MRFLKRVVRFAAAVINDQGFEYEAGGKPFSCGQCGNVRFQKSKAQLNTAGMTFLGLDWANRTATTLMCDNCGLIHWFAKTPTPATSQDV